MGWSGPGAFCIRIVLGKVLGGDLLFASMPYPFLHNVLTSSWAYFNFSRFPFHAKTGSFFRCFSFFWRPLESVWKHVQKDDPKGTQKSPKSDPQSDSKSLKICSNCRSQNSYIIWMHFGWQIKLCNLLGRVPAVAGAPFSRFWLFQKILKTHQKLLPKLSQNRWNSCPGGVQKSDLKKARKK